MFVILLKYVKPLDEVERVRPTHRAFLDTLYEKKVLLASGPQVPMTGGVLLAHGMDKRELLEILDQDPFKTEGIAEYTLIEFDPVKYRAELEDLI
jgi:uncharacterized protein YciI